MNHSRAPGRRCSTRGVTHPLQHAGEAEVGLPEAADRHSASVEGHRRRRAVMPELHKRGIGSALVRHGLGVLAERAVPLVFLEGDPGYYSRFGFAPGGGLGFRKPSLRIPDGAFQVIRFPGHEPWMTGTLVYAEPFWRHDAVGLRDPNA